MTAISASTSEVELLFGESFHEVLGPPGARGLNERGRLYEPADANPSEGKTLLNQIQSDALGVGLKVQTKRTRTAVPVKRYDFGTTTNVVTTLLAAGGGAAIVALLKGARPLLVQWLKNRSSRSLTITRGDTTIHIKGESDIAKAVKLLEHLESAPNPAANPKKKEKVVVKRASKNRGDTA